MSDGIVADRVWSRRRICGYGGSPASVSVQSVGPLSLPDAVSTALTFNSRNRRISIGKRAFIQHEFVRISLCS